MKQNNGRLLLKIRKRRDTLPPLPTKYDDKSVGKENQNSEPRKKRLNPFAKNDIQQKSLKVSSATDSPVVKKANLFDKLNQVSPKKVFEKRILNTSNDSCSQKPVNDEITSGVTDTMQVFTYKNENFPLDWSLKQRIRFISSKPFSSWTNVKSFHVCKGLSDYAQQNYNNRELSSSLYHWIHPCLPGIPNLPSRNKPVSFGLKDDKVMNVLVDNKVYQELVLQQWKVSFHSLFDMLKNGFCPYFYLCHYQFTALFKVVGTEDMSVEVIITPTTKGFRKLLTDEGIAFEFPHKKSETPENNLNTDENKETNLDVSLNDSTNEEFLDSIGLSKQQHFPNIQEQQRLQMKLKLKQLDNRPESTVLVKNSQGFFNFLLNASFLCVPSGSMAGAPPTLISPTSFEGATLSKCKNTHGPIKHQIGMNVCSVYCMDISGYILPTQLKELVDSLANNEQNDLIIQTKSYDLLQPLNLPARQANNKRPSNSGRLAISSSTMAFLNQSPQQLPDTCEIEYVGNQFRF